MYKVDDIELGKRIRKYREMKGLSQHDLYEKTGISTTQISSYENGNRAIGLQTIAKLAVALGVSIDDIYFGSYSFRPISTSNNEGELIVNCVSSLFDKHVIAALSKEGENAFVPSGGGYYYQIGFLSYLHILNDLVIKLDDYEKNKENYPDPEGFKKQLLASAAKQINDSLK